MLFLFCFFLKLRFGVTCVEASTLVFFAMFVLGLTEGGLLVDLGEAGASVGAGVCWLGAPGEGRVDGSAELEAGESARARGSWLAAGREKGEDCWWWVWVWRVWRRGLGWR